MSLQIRLSHHQLHRLELPHQITVNPAQRVIARRLLLQQVLHRQLQRHQLHLTVLLRRQRARLLPEHQQLVLLVFYLGCLLVLQARQLQVAAGDEVLVQQCCGRVVVVYSLRRNPWPQKRSNMSRLSRKHSLLCLLLLISTTPMSSSSDSGI